MSVQIENIVLHQLIKKNGEINIISRNEPLHMTPQVEAMASELNRVYNLKTKTYGFFSENSQFAALLQQYRKGNLPFITFTQQATQILHDELIKYTFAKGGVLVFCHYRFLSMEYLFISLIEHCDSMRVNESLEISTTHYLDISHLDIAAQISLTEWDVQPESKRYLTFLKGRVGRKIADFFMDSLSAEEGFDKKVQNQKLLSAVTDYCDQAELDKQEKNAYQKQVYQYCQNQIQSGEEISVDAFSNALSFDDEKPFAQFVEEENYQLEPIFPADRRVIKQFTKYSGSGSGVTLSFDVELLGERIFWDEATDTLTLKGLPPNLRDQLKRRLSSEK